MAAGQFAEATFVVTIGGPGTTTLLTTSTTTTMISAGPGRSTGPRYTG